MCVTARLVCALCVYALASSAPLAFFLSTYVSVVDGYSIEASDGSLPQGIVRIGESFNITLSDSVYGTLSADFAQVYVGFQCAWPDALGIILPENTCTRRVAQSLLSCSFRLDPEREISSYLLSAPFLYLCFAPNSTTPVVSLGTIRMRIPFQNPRRFLPKVILANAVARLRVVSTQMLDGSPLAQPLPTDTDFQFTVIGSNAETFLGEVALSSDTCRTFIGTATVSQSSPQSIVVVVTGGLPRGQYMVCFRRTVNASWLGVSSLIGHPVNDIQIGTDYYGAATPSVVTFTVQPVVPNGNTQNSPLALGLTITNTTTTMAPYAQFGDLITVHMTFPPRAMPTALYIGLDYAFNACILPVFSAVQKLSLPSSNTSTTVSWSVSPTHDRSVLNLSNWSLSACFAYAPLPESLPNQVTWSTPSENAIAGGGSQLWNTMGPTSLIVYECDSSAASIPGGEGCVVCPAYNGDTCSRNAGHGVCGRPVPLLSMYQEAANCVCYAGYQGVACEVTVCTAPDVSPSQSELDMEDTYSHPLTITVVPQQAECTAYIRVYEVVPDASGSTVNVLVIPDTPLSTSSNAYTLSISGVLLVETWSGGPVQTNVNSAIVSRTLALDLVAFPPTIIRPVDGSLVADDLGALRVELSTAEQPVEGCQTLVQVRTTLTAAEQATGLYGSASDRIVVGPAQYDAMGDDDFSLDVLPHLSDATQELFVDAWSSCPGMRNSTIVTVRTQFDPQLEWMPSVLESGSYLRLTAPAWAQDVRFTSTLGAYAMNIATCTCSVEAECTSGGEGRYTMRALYPGDHTCTVALPGIGTATFPLRMVRPPVERSVFAPSDLDLIVLYSYMPDISEVGLSIVRPLPIGLNDSSSVQVWISTSDSYAQAYNLEDANRTTMVSYRSCIFARYVHAAFVDATETPLYEQICFHAAEGTPYVVTWRYRTVPLFHTATDLDQALNLLKVSSDAHTNDSSTRPAVKQTKRSNKHVQYESFLLSILIVSIAITFLLLTMTMFVVPQCGRYLVWEFVQWLFNKQSNEVHT